MQTIASKISNTICISIVLEIALTWQQESMQTTKGQAKRVLQEKLSSLFWNSWAPHTTGHFSRTREL